MNGVQGALPQMTDYHPARPPRGVPPQIVSAALALGVGVLAGVALFCTHPAKTLEVEKADVGSVRTIPPASMTRDYSGLLDPFSAMGSPITLARSTPLAPHFEPAFAASPVEPPQNAAAIQPAPQSIAMAEVAPEAAPALSQLVESIPLPAPRPPELKAAASPTLVRPPSRQFAQRGKAGISPVNPPDNRGFFERLFGTPQPAGPALAYAAPEDGIFGNSRRLTGGSVFSSDRGTAVYDIAAHIVTLPDGTRLEAHSGLGALLDDPHHVNERMRGATPPAVYDLQLREQLFHGVQALRLNPVGGGTVYGRTGLLAHTFMLGPNGDSNGCVSFRDYNAFLRAYMNGEVKRLVVVAGRI